MARRSSVPASVNCALKTSFASCVMRDFTGLLSTPSTADSTWKRFRICAGSRPSRASVRWCASANYSIRSWRARSIPAPGNHVPRVESPELLEKAIGWTKFPPVGVRGFGLTGLQVDHEKVTIPQIIEHLNAQTMVVLQIETRRALEARNELLAVPGVDVVMVGPADLRFRSAWPESFSIPP